MVKQEVDVSTSQERNYNYWRIFQQYVFISKQKHQLKNKACYNSIIFYQQAGRQWGR